jgi:hypothetical protein
MKNIPIFSFIGLTVAAIALVIYGVLTHKEAGFTAGGSTRWEKSDFPLRVSVVQQDMSLDGMNREALSTAMSQMNWRLGFKAFQLANKDAHVAFLFQVPYEKGKMETSGLATCKKGWCKVEICNVPTVTEMTLAIRHELGHVLGLDHDDFEDSLMYGGELKEGQQYRLTDYDRSLIRAKYSP